MAYRKYTNQELYDILYDTDNFIKKHPELTRNQIITLRRYHRKTGLKMEQEPTGRLYKTWEVSAFNPKTEEWTTAVNHGYDYTPTVDPEVFTPAEAARITPTKRRIHDYLSTSTYRRRLWPISTSHVTRPRRRIK